MQWLCCDDLFSKFTSVHFCFAWRKIVIPIINHVEIARSIYTHISNTRWSFPLLHTEKEKKRISINKSIVAQLKKSIKWMALVAFKETSFSTFFLLYTMTIHIDCKIVVENEKNPIRNQNTFIYIYFDTNIGFIVYR